MLDIQNLNDDRGIVIDQVGVRDLRHPIKIVTKYGLQHTIANFDISVELPANVKGTHMSRLVEVINDKEWNLSLPALSEMEKIISEKLNARKSFVSANFIFFKHKKAPVSKKIGSLDYNVTMKVEGDNYRLIVAVPVTTLCPCSKEISKYNAHNQRSIVTVNVLVKDNIFFEDLIDMIEKSASCELFSIIKREDEKYVTETAYENPKFVEDIVRDVVIELKKNNSILNYTVESENLESIHNHSAYAIVRG